MANNTYKTYTGPGAPKQSAEGVLLGFGNPLLDLVATVPREFFEKYDVKPDNAILAEDKHKPMYSELAEKYEVEFVAGGATQNVMRAAQWILRTDKATTFFGAVGKDEFAGILKRACSKDGVNPLYYETDEAPTGRCAAIVLDKERSLIADLAAANCYKFEHSQTEEIQKAIAKAQIIYVGGFPLSVPESHKTILEMCKNAAVNNQIFCLNLGAPFIVDIFYDRLESVLPYTDYIFCNEGEAETLIKKKEWNCSLEEAALKLSALPKASGLRCRTVIFTQGSQKTIVAKEGKITLYPVPPLSSSRLIDTNGAGDSFVGGFLARLSQGFEIPECVRTGHYTARVVIQRSGVVYPEEPDI